MSDGPWEERPAEPALRFEELASLGRNGWWRYLLAVALFLVLAFVGINATLLFFVFALAEAGVSAPGWALHMMLDQAPDWSAVDDGSALVAFVGLMIAFVPPLLATFAVVRLVHRRSWRTLLSARRRFGWRAALFSLAVTWAVLAAPLLPGLLLAPGDVRVTFELRRFLLFLPFVLALVPLQVLAEEVLFRGYLLQTVRRFTANPAILVAVPAALFLVPHLWNPEVAYGGIWAILDYAAIALYLGVLALRGNGLEYSFGFHAGINLFLFLVIGSAAAPYPNPTVLYVQQPDFALGLLTTLVTCPVHYWILFRSRLGFARRPPDQAPSDENSRFSAAWP